jgi:hypothetical protein
VRLVYSDAEMAFALIMILCSRIRCISSQLEDRSLLALEARLARRLLALSPRVGDEREAFQSVQSDLADSLGASREAINKLLNRFRNFGWIDLSRGAISIRDEDAISAVINAVARPRILRGKRTNELPVELPTVFDLAINLKAAKLLDAHIPDALIAAADTVVE